MELLFCQRRLNSFVESLWGLVLASTMFHMNVEAQQAVVDSISCFTPSKPTFILCHNPSEITSMNGELISVGTHDLFDEYYCNDAIQVISVFPNISSIKRVLATCEGHHFCFDCIFACHHGCDPIEVITDMCSKFGTLHGHISDISFLTELKKRTFRPFATVAYRVRICSAPSIGFDLFWRKPHERLDEFLISKAIAGDQRVRDVANDSHGPLVCKSTKANGCFDFEKIGNMEPLSFRPSNTGVKAYKEELAHLYRTCQEVGREMPSAVIQFKERVSWSTVRKDGSVERTILICRSLDHQKIGEFATFLTTCQIPFYLSNSQTIVINAAGLDSCIMVRLMHYAEVPIPTSMKQGAFSIYVKGCGAGSDDRNFLRLNVRIDRIGSLPYSPMQIPMRNLRALISEPLHESIVGKWLKSELSAVNLCEVVCLNEEQVADKYLQFHVPIDDEHLYPQEVHVQGKSIKIEHALPYATPFTTRARPPYEESVHEHWKNSAKLGVDEKRGRVNCVTKTEGSGGSFQRQLNLLESSMMSGSKRVVTLTEHSEMPWIFFNSQVESEYALAFFQKYLNKMKNNVDMVSEIESSMGKSAPSAKESAERLCLQVLRINCSDEQPVRIGFFHQGKKGWNVCTSELLQCHAYTDCTMIILTPAGYKLSDVCSPTRHISVCKTIVFTKGNIDRSEDKTTQVSVGLDPCSGTMMSLPYTQASLPKKKQGEAIVSPTAPWGDTVGTMNGDAGRSKQLPVPKKTAVEVNRIKGNGSKQEVKTARQGRDASRPAIGRDENDKAESGANEKAKVKANLRLSQAHTAKADTAACDKSQASIEPLAKFLQGAGRISQDSPNSLGRVGDAKAQEAMELAPGQEEAKVGGNETPSKQSEKKAISGNYVATTHQDVQPMQVDDQPKSLLPELSHGRPEKIKNDRNINQDGEQDVTMQISEADAPNVDGKLNLKNRDTRLACPNSQVEPQGHNRRVVRKSPSCPPFKRDASPITKIGNTRLKEKNSPVTRARGDKGKCSLLTKGNKTTVEIDKTQGEQPPANYSRQNTEGGPAEDTASHDVKMQVHEQVVSESTQQIIDLCLQLEQEEKEEAMHRRELVTDAVSKWSATIAAKRQERIIHLGEQFLKKMDSTICFLVVAYRLLSKAMWTKEMICIDVRQAALYAISKGWYLKTIGPKQFPFSKAELAIAAGSYLGRIPAGKSEDPFFALKVLVDSLPLHCAKLFSKGTVKCPHCEGQCEVGIPSVTSHITWMMTEWISIEDMIQKSTPIPWVGMFGWHMESCVSSEHTASVQEWGTWILVEFCVQDRHYLPPLQITLDKQWNEELDFPGGQILGYVCTNTLSTKVGYEHYWYVEIEPGKPPFVYDSLQGLVQLTQELARKLRVYGVLLSAGARSKPTLHNAELDLVAGVVPAVLRKSMPIKVISRGRVEKIRNFLYKASGVRKCKRTKGNGAVGKRKATPAANRVRRTKEKLPLAEVRLAQVRKKKKSNPIAERSMPLERRRPGAQEKTSIGTCELATLFRRQQEVKRAICTPVPDDPIEEISDEDFNPVLNDPIEMFSDEVARHRGGRRNGEHKEEVPPALEAMDVCEGMKHIATEKAGETSDSPQQTAAFTSESSKLQKEPVGNLQSSPKPLIALKNQVSLGAYGIISLFDGVSSVVRTLKQKLNKPPTAVILAENDEKLRGLVCAEFGYRADQKWGYTQDGIACLYVKDVYQLIADDCKILRETVGAFPDLKWFVVGGSPCQDLTFAGPSQGMLGLVGAQSRLFFVLLCVIRTMQMLVGIPFIRFLVENAGSMKVYHLRAFCKLLGLDSKDTDGFIWDLLKHTPYISRKRNFFRNFDDCEPMQPISDFFHEGNGPLVTLKGQIMPLAPLLRTRGCSNFGICHSSWTLYQPHALVWDYNFWGGKQNFAQACRLSDGKIPFLGWDRIVPPPFLDQWKTFLDLLKKGNRISRKFDETIAPLLPLFGCNTYQVPFRVLREQEVMNLSGLGSYWVNTSIEDSERLPENAIRDMCGNSFHPALISSALGSNSVIREWINNKAPGPDVPVANQCEALSIYTELCDLVATEIEKKKTMSKQAVVRDLPMYPIVEKATSKVGLIQIEPATIVGFRPVEVSKTDKKRELAIEAAIYVIEQQACVLFEQHGIRQYFEAFRADIRRPFTCQDYVDLTFGPKQSRVVTEKITPFSPNRPVQSLLDRLQKSFENFEKDRSVASFLTCLVDATALKQPTTWPVGHVVIVQNNRKPSIFYVGAAQPKLLLVVMWNQLENPWLGVLAATAYAESLTLGRVPIVCQEVHEVGCLDQVNQCFVECLAGQWSIRFDRHIASQGGCPICFLSNMGVFDFCPWHSTSGDTEDTRGDCTRQILHLVAKYQAPGTVNVFGYIDEIPLHCRILMFHVLPEQHWKTLRSRICYLDSPFLLTAHIDIAPERCNRENTLAEAFGNQNLPSFLFHHFLLRAAGPSDILNTWLQPRSLL